MVLPNLKHPVNITVQVLNTTTTVFDNRHREPIQQSSRTADQTVPGQVAWFGQEQEVDVGGRKVDATGYVLFRYVDLQAKSITLKFNDRFSRLGNTDALLYIVGLTPIGHYSDQGGATMVKAFFNDKQPTKGGFNL